MLNIDDEPIPGVDAPLSSNNATSTLGISNTLNPIACVVANKQKRETSSLDKPSNNSLLLADSNRELTAMLAQALAISLEYTLALALVLPALTPALAPAQLTLTPAPQPSGIENKLSESQALWEKIASIDAYLTKV